jgi:hypothetical protein
MALITLIKSLPSDSPIYDVLSTLWLFNILCGDDDLTRDWDWKHILKRFRNTLLHLKGILIDNTEITAAILKINLIMGGMNEHVADAILAPMTNRMLF